jgi:hypothetical protein
MPNVKIYNLLLPKNDSDFIPVSTQKKKIQEHIKPKSAV